MTIRVTRLRRQYYGETLMVYLDDRPVGRLAPSKSGDIRGNGRAQELLVKCAGFADSPPLSVTDPGVDLLLGVLVTYTKHRKLFARTTKSLHAEVMGPAIRRPLEDPSEG
jgi:hypothetical protein